MRLTFASLLAVAALVPATARAQVAAFRPRPSSLFAPPPAALPAADTLDLPSTYWREGALIAGIPGFFFGGYAGNGLCGMDESGESDCTLAMLGGAVMGAVVFGVTGAMIGGMIEKPVP
jgi:hypothetical protein